MLGGSFTSVAVRLLQKRLKAAQRTAQAAHVGSDERKAATVRARLIAAEIAHAYGQYDAGHIS